MSQIWVIWNKGIWNQGGTTVYQAVAQFICCNMQVISSPNAVIFEYCFSDGIGQIIVLLAKEMPLSHLLLWNCYVPLHVPSLGQENFTGRNWGILPIMVQMAGFHPIWKLLTVITVILYGYCFSRTHSFPNQSLWEPANCPDTKVLLHSIIFSRMPTIVYSITL